jgi:hypothetical protein
MPNIKKIVVSGSGISQLTNDAGYALATNITGAFTAVSTSIAVDIAALELAVGSGGTLISSSAQIATDISGAFTALSGGFSTRITTNETNIATNTTNIGTNTTNIGTLTAATASYALKTDISGAFTAVSGGLAGRINLLETQGSTNAQTASFVNSNDVEFLNVSGQNQTLTSVSTSIAGRTTVLEGTGTIQGVGTTNDVTFKDITATGNVSITGTLFVDGTTTTINSTNLNIEDKFILLNSGSTGASGEGGIIVESGSTGTGNAFYYDASNNRWSLKGGLVATNTGAVTADAFMSVAIVDTLANAESSSYYQAGNIIIDGQDFYIVTV